MIIQDGSGKGFSGKVDSSLRLHVDSVTFGRSEIEVELGNGYNINTGVINLTTANKSAVLYFKNNESDPIVVTSLFYMMGNSTSGSGDVLISLLRNPTTGTIISNATNAEMAGINRNFGSSKTLSANIYKGAEGNTFANGDKIIETILNQAPKREVLAVGDIVLTKGTSIGLEITPASGNTSLNVEFAMSLFLDTLAEDN
jgi:hypothetical protein